MDSDSIDISSIYYYYYLLSSPEDYRLSQDGVISWEYDADWPLVDWIIVSLGGH